MSQRTGGIVVVNDRMQSGYAYALTATEGEDFDPEFRPDLTPKAMLALGVFGGKYMTDCREEFPADWFVAAKLSPSARDPSLNYFGVDASQSLTEWRRKGWIHPDDPRGWFQWYCRYYLAGACRRRRAADWALEGDPPPCRADPSPLRTRRSPLPTAPAPSAAALGL